MNTVSHPDLALSHLEILRSDARDEIKRRIDQRDRYSIQLTLALAGIIAFAFSKSEFKMALIAVPLISIYFTVLILYSYRVHGMLARYLREEIEPVIAKQVGTSAKIELETWYKTQAVPGIRRGFFIITLWVVTVLTMAYLLLSEWIDVRSRTVILTLTVTYIVFATVISISFWRKHH